MTSPFAMGAYGNLNRFTRDSHSIRRGFAGLAAKPGTLLGRSRVVPKGYIKSGKTREEPREPLRTASRYAWGAGSLG
jgi:hypothetical protein